MQKQLDVVECYYEGLVRTITAVRERLANPTAHLLGVHIVSASNEE